MQTHSVLEVCPQKTTNLNEYNVAFSALLGFLFSIIMVMESFGNFG